MITTTPEMRRRAAEMQMIGHSQQAIAKELGVHPMTAWSIIREGEVLMAWDERKARQMAQRETVVWIAACILKDLDTRQEQLSA